MRCLVLKVCSMANVPQLSDLVPKSGGFISKKSLATSHKTNLMTFHAEVSDCPACNTTLQLTSHLLIIQTEKADSLDSPSVSKSFLTTNHWSQMFSISHHWSLLSPSDQSLVRNVLKNQSLTAIVSQWSITDRYCFPIFRTSHWTCPLVYDVICWFLAPDWLHWEKWANCLHFWPSYVYILRFIVSISSLISTLHRCTVCLIRVTRTNAVPLIIYPTWLAFLTLWCDATHKHETFIYHNQSKSIMFLMPTDAHSLCNSQIWSWGHEAARQVWVLVMTQLSICPTQGDTLWRGVG